MSTLSRQVKRQKDKNDPIGWFGKLLKNVKTMSYPSREPMLMRETLKSTVKLVICLWTINRSKLDLFLRLSYSSKSQNVLWTFRTFLRIVTSKMLTVLRKRMRTLSNLLTQINFKTILNRMPKSSLMTMKSFSNKFERLNTCSGAKRSTKRLGRICNYRIHCSSFGSCNLKIQQ